MKTVDVSYGVQLSADELVDALSPRDIVEYTDVFEIQSHRVEDRTEVITVSFEDDVLVFAFSEIDGGYEYELTDSSGLFAQRYSKITVRDGGDETETEVAAETRFTFDTRWSFILDWLMADIVEQELDRLVANLVAETNERGD